MDLNQNGWTEWSKYVLKTLESQAEEIKAVNKILQQIKVDIAMLQVKSGAWGAIGALLVVVLAKVVKF